MNKSDEELIYSLAEVLTNTCQSGPKRRSVIVSNVEKRMLETGIADLAKYLNFAVTSSTEMDHLMSSLTIHTTSWFREMPHFDSFEKYMVEKKKMLRPFRLLCAACSTGEEPYSFALVLEKYRKNNPHFEYEVIANDIDSVSVNHAQRAIYPVKDLKSIPERYRDSVLVGSGKTESLMTLDPEIRKRVKFQSHDLRKILIAPGKKFDFVVCRNVLIYFDEEQIKHVIKFFKIHLEEDGVSTSINVDEAYLTKGNLESSSYFIKAGQFYVPFGKFDTAFISDPLTLDFAETNDSAVLFGKKISDIEIQVYALNGKTIKAGSDENIDVFGVTVSGSLSGLEYSFGYISNLAASDSFSDAIIGPMVKIPSGVFVSLGYVMEKLKFGLELIQSSEFDVADLPFDGSGATPMAAMFEVNYEMGEYSLSLGYQMSDELLGADRSRTMLGVSRGASSESTVALELLSGNDYETSVGGTGDSKTTVSMQWALEF
ncbi:MAG: LbtU family siderophore porin [Bdellovibrionales bacterium]